MSYGNYRPSSYGLIWDITAYRSIYIESLLGPFNFKLILYSNFKPATSKTLWPLYPPHLFMTFHIIVKMVRLTTLIVQCVRVQLKQLLQKQLKAILLMFINVLYAMPSSVPNVKVNQRTLSKQANDSERRRGNGSRSNER